jgi:hypothetical protein
VSTSWKTTVTAAVSAAASFVLFSYVLHMILWPQWVLAVALFAQAGGLLSLGISAKDFDMVGGTKSNGLSPAPPNLPGAPK